MTSALSVKSDKSPSWPVVIGLFLVLLVIAGIGWLLPRGGDERKSAEFEASDQDLYPEPDLSPISDPFRWQGQLQALPGTDRPGETIQVSWQASHPRCPRPPCRNFINLTKMEAELGKGNSIRLGRYGSFELLLPAEPGVYAFPAVFTYMFMDGEAQIEKFIQKGVDVMYFVAPPGATCQYKHWNPDVRQIPHSISARKGFWVVEITAAGVIGKTLSHIQCSDGKSYFFRGSLRYAKGSWSLERARGTGVSTYEDVVPPNEFSTEGMSDADFRQKATFRAEIREPGHYSASFCLSSPPLRSDRAEDDLNIELIDSPTFAFFAFTDHFSGCAMQRFELPPAPPD